MRSKQTVQAAAADDAGPGIAGTNRNADQISPPTSAPGAATPQLGASLDFNKLRLSQDFQSMVGVKKALVTVPIRKPAKQEFVRVHPDGAYQFQTLLLHVKEDNEFFIVNRSLWAELEHELLPYILFLAINRQGVVFVWPARLPSDDGRSNSWHDSALHAAELARESWIRVTANMSLGAYDVFEAGGNLPDPEWPEGALQDFLNIAFRDRFIETSEHQALRQLRGVE